MACQTHSGFAKFATDAHRHTFLKQLADHDPILSRNAYVSGSRPDVLFENLSDDQLSLIKGQLLGQGQWIDDVQFQHFDPVG